MFQSSYNPQPIFSPQMSQQGANLAMGHAAKMANPDSLQKHLNLPGRSFDAGTLSTVMPRSARMMAQGQAQAASIPLYDELANQENILRGSSGQANEYLGMGGLLARLQAQQNNQMTPYLQNLMEMLN